MYYVYILKSQDYQKSYTGTTNNLERRIEEHNLGKSFYTQRYLPWKLIYKEEFDQRKDARKREKYFKSAAGRRFLKRIFDNYCEVV